MQASTTPVRGDAPPARGNGFTKWLADWGLRRTGWQLVGEFPNVPKMVIIGAPHTSGRDFYLTMMTIFTLGIHVSWMGKESLFRWPLGGIMTWLGGIAIDRSASTGLVEQTVAAFQARDKLLLALAPEGTRKRGKPWKTGFYHMAHGANVQILMVYVDNPGKRLVFGPAFQTTGDFDGDMAQIRAFYANEGNLNG